VTLVILRADIPWKLQASFLTDNEQTRQNWHDGEHARGVAREGSAFRA
jgi:hypothetical protein